MKPELHRALDACGLTDALMSIGEDLARKHDEATNRWLAWLDIPAFMRRGMAAKEAELAAACKLTSTALDRFVSNPLAVVPIALGFCTCSEFAQITGAPLLQVAAMSGPHVAFLTLEVAEA
jgi:hypothetical protein